MSFEIGEINNLQVKRKTDIGYILVNEDDEDVLLHNNQTKEEINIGDYIDVFIYFDNKKRLTATMEKPFITVSNPGILEVIEVRDDLGVFVNNNISKDLLISRDDLPLDETVWPHKGDRVFCKLKNTKTQLIAKLVSAEELKSLVKPTAKLNKFDKVNATVIKSGKQGLNLLSKDNHSIFVYYKNKRREYHIGEEVEVTINNINNDIYNGTLLDDKVPLMKEDADTILQYIKDNNGSMPITAKSDLKDIEQTFKMSKASFKRALGNLYKQHLIEFDDNNTYLTKKDN